MASLGRVFQFLSVGFIITLISNVASCALMPRTTFDSDTENIVESKTTTAGKYQVNIYPLNQSADIKNSKSGYVYRIGNRDQILITVWGHPEFSSQTGINLTPKTSTGDSSSTITGNSSTTAGNGYMVDETGRVYLPLIGGVNVQNKSIKEVRDEMTKKISEYVVNPQVSISVAAYRSKMVYVVGEVNQANIFYLNDVPLDLAQALTMAGWVNLSTANVKEIYVLRQTQESAIDVYRLNAATPSALIFASAFILRPSDVVFVSTAGIAQFDRVMTHFVSTATVIWDFKYVVDPNNSITFFPSNN